MMTKKKIRCSDCEHNPMGVCEMCGKEIAICYIIQRKQGAPAWCPLIRGKKDGLKSKGNRLHKRPTIRY